MKFLKTKRWLNSKSFWGSVVFATALWGYTSLNSEYQTLVEVPLSVKLPSSRALEAKLPPNIYVDVRGSGWNLFNLIFFNSAKSCYVDLSSEMITDSLYRISRTEIQKGIQYLKNVNPVDVLPESIVMKTGSVGEYFVRVKPQILVEPRQGFTVVGDYEIEPYLVKITGNDRIAKRIKSWMTSRLIFEDVNNTFTASVPLLDTLTTVLDYKPKFVNIKVQVQQEAEITIPDVELIVMGGSLPKSHRISPRIVTLTLRGGADELAKLDPADISAALSYDDIVNDSTGILKPIIKTPLNMQLIATDPPLIHHFVRIEAGAVKR